MPPPPWETTTPLWGVVAVWRPPAVETPNRPRGGRAVLLFPLVVVDVRAGPCFGSGDVR
jgi:hypothetical protein